MTHNGECPTIRNDGQWGMAKIGQRWMADN